MKLFSLLYFGVTDIMLSALYGGSILRVGCTISDLVCRFSLLTRTKRIFFSLLQNFYSLKSEETTFVSEALDAASTSFPSASPTAYLTFRAKVKHIHARLVDQSPILSLPPLRRVPRTKPHSRTGKCPFLCCRGPCRR